MATPAKLTDAEATRILSDLMYRPPRDIPDPDLVRILSDQLEEHGLDAGAALLRDVASYLETERQDREAIVRLLKAQWFRSEGEAKP